MRAMGMVLCVALVACGGDDDDVAVDLCAGFTAPARVDLDSCADIDVSAPGKLFECSTGSGYAGRWAVDADGLPAYDFEIEQRCDPAGQSWSPASEPLRDPVHLIGNGRGLVAMAHASGGVEIYSQDRGHKWINRIDTWRDPENEDFPPQLGGGFNYVVVGDEILSTRFEDLPVGEATERQVRRFGVGYFETVTSYDTVVVTRRVFAPDDDARALVAEITLANPTDGNKQYGLVELWDVNTYQVPVEFLTSDLLNPSTTENLVRKRRALMEGFEHIAEYVADERLATVRTIATEPGASSRDVPSDVDYYPDPVYLAQLDQADVPDAVWLRDDELWGDGRDRSIPDRAGDDGDADTRQVEFGGGGQHGLLAMRVPVQVPAGSSVTRRFAFGYAPGGATVGGDVGGLRARFGSLRADAVASWTDRVVWAAFDGIADAGAIQRELAWSSYYTVANATYDEYHGVRLAGQGGSYKYIHGLDGAIGDLCLYAEALVFIDPGLARDTLEYSMATQHASSSATPWRYPYATTGVGNYSDVGLYTQRSDAYFLVPSSTARYVAATRDFDFLDADVAYWPRASGETGSVIDHLERTIEYARDTLGNGAHGLIAMGTGDYADGVLSLTDDETTPGGTSSTYNAGFVVHGFGLAAAVAELRSSQLAADLRAMFDEQANALNASAWSGRLFYRGFVDNGNPLAPDILFLEPQLFPILAGIISPTQRDELLDMIAEILETDIGAMSNTSIDGAGGGMGGIDEPQISGVWPVANAWLTEAYASRDPAMGWDSFARNTLFAHAAVYPELWYGIWTGPDSYNGPDHERPGEADAHAATALTDYPALNMHVHTGPLRALRAIMGITPVLDGLRIEPRLPTETYSVRWPRLSLAGTPRSIGGSFTSSANSTLMMHVLLPTELRDKVAFNVMVKGAVSEYTRDGDVVSFVLPGQRDAAVAWSIEPLGS